MLNLLLLGGNTFLGSGHVGTALACVDSVNASRVVSSRSILTLGVSVDLRVLDRFEVWAKVKVLGGKLWPSGD
jgi:hypothetical protein